MLYALAFLLILQILPTSQPLFQELSPNKTGIEFQNTLIERPGSNILESEFFYNGGGVAVGDINADELTDIYFTANQGENALYVNKGNFEFQNVTKSAGVSDMGGWSAGVSMGDVNADGLLDLYVCKAGKVQVAERRNKLFVNQGLNDQNIPQFREMAVEYGLDDPGYCTQSVFFDYNRDGLLDLFIVNYNTRDFTRFDITTIRNETDKYAGDKLYRNNGDGTFSNVSEEAGIFQNPIGFGLSATVSDLNDDGWPDIYVTNDYMERDYMYINQGDGTFVDEILSRTNVTSYFSMGSDITDIDNNGTPDVLTVDMLPPGYERRSVFKTPDYSIYERLAAHGYHRKNMRNTLQINDGSGMFTEVGQLAGISATDWSWASLIADFDNDGQKDVFITNGFPRFYTDLDYLNNILWEQFPESNLPDDPELKYNLSQKMEPVQMHNFAFRNQGNYSFQDVSDEWGLKNYSVSGAAAYADFDNDGDLDLVVNNWNEPPSVYENTMSAEEDRNYLKIKLRGNNQNRYGIGSKITIIGPNDETYFREAFLTRGFQSSVDPVLHFGLNSLDYVDIEIIWPDQSKQLVSDVQTNQAIVLNQSEAEKQENNESNENPLFLQLDPQALGIEEGHQPNVFRDRIFSPLMPYTLSNLGPAMASADINTDGLQDLFIGGGQGQAARIYLQKTDGTFQLTRQPVFQEHQNYEDVDALFFDADGNGTVDLYVVSGGNFDQMNSYQYQDRLYLNDGFGNYRHASDAIPKMYSSGGAVTVLNIDEDNDPDLFIGGRVLTGQYPLPPRSYLLRNDEGIFTEVTTEVAPDLVRPGLVTDAVWFDTNSDGKDELVIAGEWMAVRVFELRNNKFIEITEAAGLENTNGWWNVLKVVDMNGDGLPDLVAGNMGLNHSLNASREDPAVIYYGDFNGNGLSDPILTYMFDGKRVPFPGRDTFLRQISGLNERFPDYESWAAATIEDILTEEQREAAYKYKADTFASTTFINNGDGSFEAVELPAEAQTAPIYDFFIGDFFGNQKPDILAVGNNFGTRPELGPIAAQGVFLRMNQEHSYNAVSPARSGFYAVGNVRQIEYISSSLGSIFFLGRYGEPVSIYLYQGDQKD